jgi:hypothetical protein
MFSFFDHWYGRNHEFATIQEAKREAAKYAAIDRNSVTIFRKGTIVAVVKPPKKSPLTGQNFTCSKCEKATNSINGRYCRVLKRYVQYARKPICETI